MKYQGRRAMIGDGMEKLIRSVRRRLERGRIVLRTIPRTAKMVWEAAPGLTAVNTVVVLVGGIIPTLSVYLMKLVVDSVVRAIQVNSQAETKHVLFIVVLWSGTQILSAVVGACSQFISGLQRDLVGNHVNVLQIEKASTLDLQYFEDHHFYDKLERAQREANSRPAQMIDQIFSLIKNAITLLSMLGLIASLSLWLVVLVVAASLPSLFVQARYSTQFFSLLSLRAPEQRRLSYLSWLLTTDIPAKEVRVFGLCDSLLGQYKALFARFFRENRDLALRRGAAQVGLVALATLVSGIMYLYVVLKVLAGRITIGGLTLYYQACQQSSQSMNVLLFGLSNMYENSLFLTNLFDFLDYQPRLSISPTPQAIPAPINRGIVLEHISFRYPGTDEWVLKDISFTIRANEAVALVGDNGAGKTTLVKLLTRLYDPTEGRILIDGIDLRDFDPAELRSRIAPVFQDYMHYQVTARENIGFGCIEELGNEERIRWSAERAGAAEVIRSLPLGFATPLGRWFQDGHELSIGQWQKMALARAFMRDADLLILDEPTASLDVRSEYEVFEAFHNLTKGKMAVLISHRFSTVRMADRIVVIEEGRVIEEGSHDELLLRSGRYAELFDLQAASYR